MLPYNVHREKEIQTHKICTTKAQLLSFSHLNCVCAVCFSALNCFTVLTFIVLVEYIGKKVKLRLSARHCLYFFFCFFVVLFFRSLFYIIIFFLVNKSAQAQAHNNKERVSSSSQSHRLQWNCRIFDENHWNEHISKCFVVHVAFLLSIGFFLNLNSLELVLLSLSRFVFVISHLTQAWRSTWEGGIFHHSVPTYLNL